MQWGNKSSYSEAELSSALTYYVNQDEFAPIAYWIDQLREKVVIELRSPDAVKNPTLMAVETGRLSMIDEVRRIFISKRATIFDVPQEVIAPKKKRSKRVKVDANIDAKTGLSVGALKYAQENGISLPDVAGEVKQPL